MSDLSITASNVTPGSDSMSETGYLGETVTAGQPVYKSSTDSLWYKADNNSATAAARTPGGIALNGGAAGQPVRVHKSGDLNVGSILTPGVAYYLSDTAGGICPVADLATGEYPCFIGIAKSASVLKVVIVASGVALS